MNPQQSCAPKGMILAIAVTLLALPATTSWAASNEQAIHVFHGNDGATPFARLIFDAAGNLYGTTFEGGDFLSDGVVFKLARGGDGKWAETVLHRFYGSPDGSRPPGGLIFDAAGNLYGTTSDGGASGAGTVFKLAHGTNGKWKETVLYSFTGGDLDGAFPASGLVLDRAGNLYGTTVYGGSLQPCPFDPDGTPPGCGIVFKLTPGAHGKWTETMLHSFGIGQNGATPSGLVPDAAGNLYGTTVTGSASGNGTVFKLTHRTNRQWTETVLHSFGKAGGEDGVGPYSDLIFDRAGNLYGTTAFGGASDSGTVFKLAHGAHGKWTETVLHPFTGTGNDGATPYGGLVLDGLGNLYGTTAEGGAGSNGTVFKLARAHGKWTETVLHSFNGHDGTGSFGGLIFDTAGGTLYGTSPHGDDLHDCPAGGCGIVFEVKP
jgi:uncharacterized repeat protein (TIGR03803 family)